MKAKIISNLIKLLIVIFVFYEYHKQSLTILRPLTADECKGLLLIAAAGFLILLPIDSSIFIKNLYRVKSKIIDDNNNHNQNTK